MAFLVRVCPSGGHLETSTLFRYRLTLALSSQLACKCECKLSLDQDTDTYLVYNDRDGKDGYAVEAEAFEKMYEPAG